MNGLRIACGLALALFCASATQAACRLERFFQLPITLQDERPTFVATVNGVEGRFLADTGAFFSLLTRSGAASLKLNPKPMPDGFYTEGSGGIASTELATANLLQVGNGRAYGVQFLVGGTDFSDGRILGAMGQNLLAMGDAEFDLAHGMINIYHTHDCGGRGLFFWGGDKPVQQVSLMARDARDQPFIRATVTVNGKPVNAVFDTGAPNTIISSRLVRRLGLDPAAAGARAMGLSGGIGSQQSRIWLSPIDEVDIGTEQVKRTELLVGDTSDQIDMLIGLDFFMSHHVFADYQSHVMTFTYEGGPVFKTLSEPPQGLQAAAAPHAAAPVEGLDADGYGRLGAALLQKRDPVGAEAALDRALALSPDGVGLLGERARIRLARQDRRGARADLDRALQLAPGDQDNRLLRASLQLRDGETSAALEELREVDAQAPKDAQLRRVLASAYLAAEQYADAVRQYDLWLRSHDDDGERLQAFNGRCWARALGDVELDRALSDCNVAVRLSHGGAEELDSRALVHLRRGEDVAALADYDAALKLNPEIAWSLYGRGLLEARAGEADKARVDVAAAEAINPKLSERARRIGLPPPPGAAAPPAPVATR